MRSWEGKNITVFGLGGSGLETIRRLAPLKANILLTESKDISQIDKKILDELKSLNVKIEASGHSENCIKNADMIVLSPGVPSDLPILRKAKELNIPVISEIELAFYFISKPIIAITGTNGKTTTTTLIGELLKSAGKKAAVAGNIGLPLISVDDSDFDYVVAEVSSYQLETINKFKPWISLILNLTEDHLKRHGTMENYGIIKAKVFSNQDENDHLIYNAEDPLVAKLVKSAKAKLVPFSKDKAKQIVPIPKEEIKIKGDHNLENVMAAVLAVKIAGISDDVIAKVLREFPGVEHRIELVRELNGVKYYNDSKATNPDSTIVALKALDTGNKNIILILGGRDKGTDLSPMCELVKKTVKNVILIGEASERFREALDKHGYKKYVFEKDFQLAVKRCRELSRDHDIVLLSPACASFDMFNNYEERGKVFKQLVKEL